MWQYHSSLCARSHFGPGYRLSWQVFVILHSSSGQIPGWYRKLRINCFLPHPLQFTVTQSFDTAYSKLLTTSLSKPTVSLMSRRWHAGNFVYYILEYPILIPGCIYILRRGSAIICRSLKKQIHCCPYAISGHHDNELSSVKLFR
jgi:hypothetical protein